MFISFENCFCKFVSFLVSVWVCKCVNFSVWLGGCMCTLLSGLCVFTVCLCVFEFVFVCWVYMCFIVFVFVCAFFLFIRVCLCISGRLCYCVFLWVMMPVCCTKICFVVFCKVGFSSVVLCLVVVCFPFLYMLLCNGIAWIWCVVFDFCLCVLFLFVAVLFCFEFFRASFFSVCTYLCGFVYVFLCM